jgi:hypothetical protein
MRTHKTVLTLAVLLCTGMGLVACDKQTEAPQKAARSVADYVHDPEAAKAVLHDGKLHPEKQNSQDFINANEGYAIRISPGSVSKCYKGGQVDHDCLDKKGYKR